MKEKILSEEGHRQQMKLKELQAVAENLGCTLPQLAIGKRRLTSSETNQPLPPQYNWLLLTLSSSAWCLRNEGVNSVLLGASSAEQMVENIKAIQVSSQVETRLTGTGLVLTRFSAPLLHLCDGMIPQVLPKLSLSILSEVENLLGNKPNTRKGL